MEISKRAAEIKQSATLAITAKVKELRAEGVDVIGFGAGEPDFDTPSDIKEAGIESIRNGFTKYTPVGGIPELKNAITARIKEDYGIEYAQDEVMVSCGAKHTLYNIAQAVLNSGDEVIVPSPYWVSYPAQIALAGSKAVIAETTLKDGFKLTPAVLKKKISRKTRALILNYPSNPTGSTYDENEIKALVDAAVEDEIFIISDEIYDKILYGGTTHTPVASLGEEARENSILVNGVSKTYSMTGWRIGYAAGGRDVIAAMSRIQGQCTSNPPSMAQMAAVEALSGEQEVVERRGEEFERRKDFIVSRVREIGFECLDPQGAFYIFPSIEKFIGMKFGDREMENSLDFTDFLLSQAKVAVVPGIEFGMENHIRISYATSMENIEEGMNRVEKALSLLSS
ncbi:MAG: aminotransferase class I/II-fold pyridoxal phosphate-dependent enzyme [Candidatus Mycalebacterium zealandia]|nr:MAG: aminotransferase class I/II-fold pyridoxal phosphate-dependent enzyme [Candidatus Mycalebacterium zealandia]